MTIMATYEIVCNKLDLLNYFCRMLYYSIMAMLLIKAKRTKNHSYAGAVYRTCQQVYSMGNRSSQTKSCTLIIRDLSQYLTH